MNLIPKICEMLGVEIGEEFRIKDESGIDEDFHRFTDCRFEYYDQAMCEWQESVRIIDLIDGRAKVVKKPFKPKKGETYYFVWFYGPTCAIKTMSSVWGESGTDYQNKYCENIFRTKEEAEKHKYELYEKLTGKKWEEKDG